MPFETSFQVLVFKVTLEGQMIKLSIIELVWAIISTFMHEFQNNLPHLFSLTCRRAV